MLKFRKYKNTTICILSLEMQNFEDKQIINFFYLTYQIKIVHFGCSHSFLNNLVEKCFSKYMVNFWTKYVLTPISLSKLI